MNQPDPLMPCLPGAQDIEAMNNRQQWIDELYVFDRRNDPDHPMHGLYTGLTRKYRNFREPVVVEQSAE